MTDDDESTRTSLEYRQLIKMPKYKAVWTRSFANELGRLGQGIQDIQGTDTIKFIPLSAIPKIAQSHTAALSSHHNR